MTVLSKTAFTSSSEEVQSVSGKSFWKMVCFILFIVRHSPQLGLPGNSKTNVENVTAPQWSHLPEPDSCFKEEATSAAFYKHVALKVRMLCWNHDSNRLPGSSQTLWIFQDLEEWKGGYLETRETTIRHFSTDHQAVIVAPLFC